MESRPNVLIVDDEVIPALSLRMELKRAGIPTCQIVTSGESAVQTALQEPLSAIVMDIHLAGALNGLEAVRRIRAAGLQTPVIFISGYSGQEYREKTDEFQPAAYLEKPIMPHEVVRILNQVTGAGYG
jgi:CheY-like chemotaxis protein